MLEFLRYFFGEGTEPEFSLLSAAHLAPVLCMLLMVFLIYRYRDTLRRFKWEETLRYAMGFTLLITDMSYYWRLVAMPSLQPSAVENLPIGVCCWATILSGVMIVGKRQSLFDIVYFWLLSGSLFALATPTVLTFTGPTRFRYYQFWMEHTMGYVAVFYLIFVHKMRPTIRSAIKSYLALVGLAVVAYFTNRLLPGANYLYMARPEAAPSVLDILPPNFALRLAIMVVAIAALYALAYLPWYIKDRKAAKYDQ